MMRRTIAVLSMLLAFVAATGCATKPMSFRPSVGQKFTITTTLQQDVGVSVMGMNTSVQQSIVTDTDLDILDRRSNGDVETRFTIRHVSVHQNLGIMTLDYDSKDASSQATPLATLYSQMIDKDYRVTFNRNGGVSKVEGLSEVLGQAAAGTGEQAAMLISNYFDDESMRELMQGQWLFFPDKALKVGDTWTRTYAITTGFPMRVDEKWTLTERNASRAVFAVDGTIAPPDKSEPFNLMGMTLILDNVRGRQSGNTEVDPRTGMARKSTVTQDLSTTMKIENIPEMPQGLIMPMTIHGTTTIEVNPR